MDPIGVFIVLSGEVLIWILAITSWDLGTGCTVGMITLLMSGLLYRIMDRLEDIKTILETDRKTQ